MNLVGYIRVSTEGQVDAFGKDVQAEAISRWAALNDHTIVEMFEEDAVSGKTDGGDRPILASLMARADEFEGILFFDATRIARRLYVQETLLGLVWATGLRVFTTTAGELEEHDDDPTRIMIRQILGVVAEFEHRSIVKKLHGARRIKSSRGGYIGGVAPYGKKVVGVGKVSQFVKNDVESEVIQAIGFAHSTGESLRSIARSLNARGVMTKTGKQWTPVQVSRIIKRNENT